MKLTSNVLHIIKILKLYVWEEEFLNRIDKERIKELKTMKKIQNVYVLSGFVHRSIPLFLAISTIGIFTTIYGKIPIENLLTSIEIFDSMANPLYRFPIFITSLLNCLISMKRIENFLKTNDIHRDSIEDKELRAVAREVAQIKTNNTAYIWSAIGVDYATCPMNCKFCSFGEEASGH